MSLTTVEVELDHGRVTPRGNESLPEHANALLTILPAKTASRDPLIQHPELGKAIFYESPALPLHREDWPDAHSSDRLIVATAASIQAAIVTSDPLIRQYPSTKVTW